MSNSNDLGDNNNNAALDGQFSVCVKKVNCFKNLNEKEK